MKNRIIKLVIFNLVALALVLFAFSDSAIAQTSKPRVPSEGYRVTDTDCPGPSGLCAVIKAPPIEKEQ